MDDLPVGIDDLPVVLLVCGRADDLPVVLLVFAITCVSKNGWVRVTTRYSEQSAVVLILFRHMLDICL